MSDLLDDSLPEWTDEELAVLRSANDDAPSKRSLPATLAAVGVGSALATGAAATKGASIAAGSATTKWTTAVALTKWIGAVVVGSAAMAGGMVALQRMSNEHAADATLRAAPVVQTAPPVNAVVAAPASAMVVSPRETAATEAPTPAAAKSPEGEAQVAPLGAVGHRSGVRSQPDISVEIAALDAARTALRGGRAPEALAALDRYDATYSRSGSLRVEATALRIEALLRSGQRSRASSLANAFLARNPKSPYAARVRALMGGS